MDLRDVSYVSGLLKKLAKHLPTQGPLQEFVHHNPLHAFQSVPFHQGVFEASVIHGAKGYLSFSEYRSLEKKGVISESEVYAAIQRHAETPEQRSVLKTHMYTLEESVVCEHHQELREAIFADKFESLQAYVHPRLFRLVGNFLDQGISQWAMSDGSETFWNTLRGLIRDSVFPVSFLEPFCREWILQKTSDEVIDLALEKILREQQGSLSEKYLSEMLRSHPGWSGMVSFLEKHPEALLLARKISLADAVALELLLEISFCKKRLNDKNFKFLDSKKFTAYKNALKVTSKIHQRLADENKIKSVWQEAYEWSYFNKAIKLLDNKFRNSASKSIKPTKAQLFFCIDDRECSLRRHIEEIDERLETFGAPGFFGIDWMFKSVGSHLLAKLCPAPVKTRYLVEEVDPSFSAKEPIVSKLQHVATDTSGNSLVRGFFSTQILGLWHGFKLALSIFLPSEKRPPDLYADHVKPIGELKLLRSQEPSKDDLFIKGFSFQEMADRVYSVLNSVGLRDGFSPLVFLIGHGASSVNNPYFSAYNCGACSGRPGAANARAFAQMANDPEVRELVKAKGISIPQTTYFVGGLHDTTRDELVFFHEDKIPASHQESFADIKATLEIALQNNAKERCRRFELVSLDITPPKALKHVRQRSHSIFEPRPELNHATNCLCVIGSRALTKGIFLDRRAFLQSYRSEQDSSGEILSSLLAAAVPVCGGINLEYYFSKTDSEKYGSGSKLSHNVMGLLGVANGVEGDLLTGLPTQMTELHPPLRLLMVIEQEPEILLACMEKNGDLKNWVVNEWVRVACLSPLTKDWYVFEKGEPKKMTLSEELASLQIYSNSLGVIEKQARDIDPVHIQQGCLA